MADLMDGINNVTALTAQINQLQTSGQTTASVSPAATAGTTQADIDNSLLNIEKGFSSLLDNLMGSSDSQKASEDKYDPFAAFQSYYQQTDAAASGAGSTPGTRSTPTVTPAPSNKADPSLNYINVPDLDLTI